MGPIVRIPQKAIEYLGWNQRAVVRHVKIDRPRKRLRYICKMIRRVNPEMWPAVTAYLEWQQAAEEPEWDDDESEYRFMLGRM